MVDNVSKSTRERKLKLKLNEYFEKSDLDQNGTLELEELEGFLKMYTGGLSFDKVEIRNIFEQIDENHGTYIYI